MSKMVATMLYGAKTLQRLAERLNSRSMSYRNLKLYRQFFLEFPTLAQPICDYIDQEFSNKQTLANKQFSHFSKKNLCAVKKLRNNKNYKYLCTQKGKNMLIHFAVKNFRGFSDRIEWNIGSPSNYDFNQYAIKNNIIKNGIIYGPNGSGKTNFGLAIFDIVNHLSQKKKKFDYLINFANGGHQKDLVNFEYTFVINNYIVEYNYSKSSNGALKKEKLVVNKNLIFNNENNSLTISDDFQLKEQTKSDLSNNANNVSIINFLLSSYPLLDNHYLILLQKFVDSMLWFRSLDKRDFIGLESQVSNIDEYIISNHLAKDFSSFLEETSGQKYYFAEQKSTDKQLMYLANGEELAFSKPFISTGTDTLKLLYYWYKHLDNASFVFVDEFDAFYHFKLSLAVCRKLFGLNCQLFMTTHNTMLMTNDLLRPDCGFILKDNVIKPLTALTNKELRFGHNIEKLYRGGTFD